MAQVTRSLVVVVAASAVLLAGCSTTVAGSGAPSHPIRDASAETLTVTASTDSAADRLARNALADLNTFWTDAYPEFYAGDAFEPLAGGYFAVDTSDIDDSLYPRDTGVGCDDLPIDPGEVEGNAFYQPDCDVIVYDSVLLTDLSEGYGSFIGPAVMAHEFGHAIQARAGYNESSIQDETQADCFAGAFTRWVVDGNSEHVTVRASELDKVLVGFIDLRDPVGTAADENQAHGSGFDRTSGFYEGYSDGVGSCRDDFGPSRLFTAATFDPRNPDDEESGGNLPVEEAAPRIENTLAAFYASFLPDFQVPTIEGFDGSTPGCTDSSGQDRELGFCESDNVVFIDGTDLLPEVDDIGDWALATAIALPYARAARASLGLSDDDAAATRSSVCLAGVYTATVFSEAFAQADTPRDTVLQLSPGDVDEGIQFLLAYGQDERVLASTELDGFELVGTFRDGFVNGGEACGLS